ncbi:MAG TPA: DNA gyrase inhibitor YacG [Candidatus Brocadiia bacterium]|nr:DNA gyrase inhibitor YacG [Candidatus Brocadiales bacterium]
MQKVKKRSEMLTINCRYCQKEIRYNSVADVPTFPFCSEQCKLIDLGLWLDEKHRIESPVSQEVEEKSSTQKNHEELEDIRDKG